MTSDSEKLSFNTAQKLEDGSFGEVAALDDKNILCVWEKEGELYAKHLQ